MNEKCSKDIPLTPCSPAELMRLVQEAGDRERIARARQAIRTRKEVSIQDARDAGYDCAPQGYIARFGRYVPEF